jgi:hypothetical protein
LKMVFIFVYLSTFTAHYPRVSSKRLYAFWVMLTSYWCNWFIGFDKYKEDSHLDLIIQIKPIFPWDLFRFPKRVVAWRIAMANSRVPG